MPLICILALAMAVTAVPVAASPDCADARTQSGMTSCAAADRQAADAALNQSYAALRAGLSPAGKSRLRSSQRAWIAFRDRECLFRSSGADGGSIAPMIAAQCAAGLSRARAGEFDRLANCPEGDLSCPR